MSARRCVVPRLHELQRRIAAALFEDAAADLSADICADGIDAVARLGIYRTQLHATFLRTLRLEYPVIARLVGSGYFNRLGLEFHVAHPSRSGDLQHIGAPFAAFLRQRFHGGPYAYLAHVAAFEWAYQESLLAAEAPGFDRATMQRIHPADFSRLHCALHPACRLFSSEYPVLDIWHANQTDSDALEFIDLASGATCVLLQRRAHGVQLHRLSAAQFALLTALARHLSLGAALDAAHNSAPAFDLAIALPYFVALGVITEVGLLAPAAILNTGKKTG
jgi:hypothetical protein